MCCPGDFFGSPDGRKEEKKRTRRRMRMRRRKVAAKQGRGAFPTPSGRPGAAGGGRWGSPKAILKIKIKE